MLARAGWSLTAARMNQKNTDGLDVPALLDRIEGEMPAADPGPQWTMNNTLAAIGINFEKHASAPCRSARSWASSATTP